MAIFLYFLYMINRSIYAGFIYNIRRTSFINKNLIYSENYKDEICIVFMLAFEYNR